MIVSFKMKGYVISNHLLMLGFQKNLDAVGFSTFRTWGGDLGFLNKIVDFGGPK